MFAEDRNKFPQVPHIQQDEKAFNTEVPDTSPGKQLKALVDRTAFLANKLGVLSPEQKLIYDLLTPLNQLLDDDGKLPFNRLLATDDQGNITTIPRPRASFTRIAIASLKSSFTAKVPGLQWIQRDINQVIRTNPSGVADDWVTSNGVTLTFNSPGQYLISATALGAMVDAHQIRWINKTIGESYDGIITQTANVPLSGHTITTPSFADHTFTLGVSGAPQPPVEFALEHQIISTQNAGRAAIDFGLPVANFNSIFMTGFIIHVAIDTVDITDPRQAIIQDFNTLSSRKL